MIWKKNIVSNFIVVLASLVSLVVLYFGTKTLPEMIRFTILSEQLGMILVLTVIVYGITVLFYARREKVGSVHYSTPFQVVCFILILIFGAFLRWQAYGTMEINNLYEAAMITTNNPLIADYKLGEFLYIFLLKGYFLFVGNHVQFGFILHSIIHLISALILSKTFARFGFLPALGGFASVLALPTLAKCAAVYSPNNLYILLFAIGMLIVFKYIRALERVERTDVKISKHILIVFFISLYLGAMVAIDGYLSVVVICFATFFWINQKHSVFSLQKRFVLFLESNIICVAIAFIFGTFGQIEAVKFNENLISWNIFVTAGLCMVFMCILYFKSEKSEMVSGFLLLIASLCVMIYFVGYTGSEFSLVVLLMIVIIGIGMSFNMLLEQTVEKHSFDANAPEEVNPHDLMYKHPLLANYKADMNIEIKDELNSDKDLTKEEVIPYAPVVASVAVASGVAVDAPVVEDVVTPEVESVLEPEVQPVVEKASESKVEEVAPVIVPEVTKEEKVEEVVEKKEIKFIENPLPVPKKHVKKTIDFDYKVPEDKMFFDVWVTNQDDFDFKE